MKTPIMEGQRIHYIFVKPHSASGGSDSSRESRNSGGWREEWLTLLRNLFGIDMMKNWEDTNLGLNGAKFSSLGHGPFRRALPFHSVLSDFIGHNAEPCHFYATCIFLESAFPEGVICAHHYHSSGWLSFQTQKGQA